MVKLLSSADLEDTAHFLNREGTQANLYTVTLELFDPEEKFNVIFFSGLLDYLE